MYRFLCIFSYYTYVLYQCCPVVPFLQDMFAVVEFCDTQGRGLAVINSQWLTPRKHEVYWPPIKDSVQFNKAVRSLNQCIDVDTWIPYKLSKIFYTTDDYDKARQKLKQAELTSDLNTDTDESKNRKRLRPKKLLDSSSDEEEVSKFQRPPKVKLNALENSDNIQTDFISRKKQSHPIVPEKIALTPGCSTLNNHSKLNSKENVTPTVRCSTPVSSLVGQQVLPQILEKLVRIEVQNEQILNILNKGDINARNNISTHLPPLPVNLPLQSIEDIQQLEEFLVNKEQFNLLQSYLASMGGNNITTRTNRILRNLLTDNIASSYSFFGRKKQDFHSLRLTNLIISSVKLGIPQSTDQEVEDVIKSWLKHAPERYRKKGKNR